MSDFKAGIFSYFGNSLRRRSQIQRADFQGVAPASPFTPPTPIGYTNSEAEIPILELNFPVNLPKRVALLSGIPV
jgi:hypothetical protein